MTDLGGLLDAIVSEPMAEDRWSVLADWLEEQDDPRQAELLRLHRRLIATCCDPDRHPERGTWQARVVELLGQGVRPCVPRRVIVLGDGVEMAFSFIPPGSFLMGSPEGEEARNNSLETQHRVILTQGYWLGIHPVTRGQWQAVMGSNPGDARGQNDLPVDGVSWDDCQEFIEHLGRKTGKRFCLPTEAEWEHACRAGTTTPFFFGETISAAQASYDGNYTYGESKEGVYRQKISEIVSRLVLQTRPAPNTTPIGSFPANAWGLYDMHGNVREWCSDWNGPYPAEEVKDPQGCDDEFGRVLRGGFWYDGPWSCRSACRLGCDPGRRVEGCGCRVLLCVG
jgi:uncharacterized protein (TIGR02996 family)